MKASIIKHTLNFKSPSGTSRGILKTKDTWFIKLEHDNLIGIGECGMFKGLSIDDRSDFEDTLEWVTDNIEKGLDYLLDTLEEFPSIQFGLEMAFNGLTSENPFLHFPSRFTNSEDDIIINGLIWMGDKAFMKKQIKQKLNDGYDCLKLKIGAIDFKSELDLLEFIRNQFLESDLEIRVDANGAFSAEEALEKLEKLSRFKLHSIEQPIKQGQSDAMAYLCRNTPLPIALDEELIGVFGIKNKQQLLHEIEPQYIILKPTLVGGFRGTSEWIALADKQGCGWWITSALESNVGLNAIAQWTYTLKNPMPQGLGTGQLFTNNIKSPLFIKNGTLRYDKTLSWRFNL